MKKITIVATILIIINFICTSFFVNVYANPDPADPQETGTTESSGEGSTETYMSMDDYKNLDEGKTTIDGNEMTISVGESDTGSVASKVGTFISSLASITSKLLSKFTREGGLYFTDSEYSAEKTGLFTINSLVFGEYLLFNAKAYQLSSQLNPDADVSGMTKSIDKIKEIGAAIGQLTIKIGIAISLPLFLIAIIRAVIARKADDLAAWKKILVRWAMCIALLFFFQYIFSAIDVVSDIFVNSLFDVRKGLETSGYQAFEVTVETDIINSIEKTGGVTSLAYSIEFLVIVIIQAIFLGKYIVRTFGIIFLYVIAPFVFVLHSANLMLGKTSNILGTLLKTYIILTFMQPFHAMFYLIFFFSLSEIAIKIPILGMILLYALIRAGSIAKAMLGWELSATSILSSNKE